MKIKSEYRGRLSLTLMFASVIFFILIISILIAGLIVYILVEFFLGNRRYTRYKRRSSYYVADKSDSGHGTYDHCSKNSSEADK